MLVTGASYSSRYELYAHEPVAGGIGLSPSKIAAIAAGSGLPTSAMMRRWL